MPSLDNHVHFCCACLGRPSHERESWQTSSVDFFLPQQVNLGKHLDLERIVCAIIFKSLEHGVAKYVTVPCLPCQVMKKSDMWLPSLLHDWIFSVEIICPKKFQDLKNQVLNTAIIVKTSGHGVADMPSLEQKRIRTVVAAKAWKQIQLYSCLGRPSHERNQSWKRSHMENL